MATGERQEEACCPADSRPFLCLSPVLSSLVSRHQKRFFKTLSGLGHRSLIDPGGGGGGGGDGQQTCPLPSPASRLLTQVRGESGQNTAITTEGMGAPQPFCGSAWLTGSRGAPQPFCSSAWLIGKGLF